MADSIESKIIDLLENAISSTNENEKVTFLKQAQELVIHNDILDNFFDEILGFQSDKCSEVRKFVAGFIEATCKKEPEYFPKVIVNLNMMLADEVPNVLKKAIQSLTQLYKVFLIWISKTKNNEEVESTWEVWSQIKNQIFSSIDLTENDGVRTQCVKFIEMVILCQTKNDSFSKNDDFSIDQLITMESNLVDIEVMEGEAKQLFEQLVSFQSKVHISSVNLMATMQSLSFIARQRSKLFFNKVVQAFEELSTNLPPTLAKSQVNSVNKQLKLLLVMLFKHPYVFSTKQQSRFSQILLSIGVKQHEINRYLQEIKKRGIKVIETKPVLINKNKRIKVEIDEEEIENEQEKKKIKKFDFDTCCHELSKKISRYDAIKAADITSKDLVTRLSNPNIVCDLIFSSIHLLPDTLSEDASSSLNEFSFTLNDLSLTAKKFAVFLTESGIGPGIDEIISKYINTLEHQFQARIDPEMCKNISLFVKKYVKKEMKSQQQSHSKVKLVQSGKIMSPSVKIKPFKLEEITKPLNLNIKVDYIEKCIARILISSNQIDNIVARENQHKIIGKFLSDLSYIYSAKMTIKEHIFQDVRSRYGILLNALYNEYIIYKSDSKQLEYYINDLRWIIESIIENCEIKDRDFFLQKFFLESPYLNDGIIQILGKLVIKSSSNIEEFNSSFAIVTSLVEKRPANRKQFLKILIRAIFEVDEVEVLEQVLSHIKKFYLNKKLHLEEVIENHALEHLRTLKNENPDERILGDSKASASWNDDTIKLCLALYLMLLPLNQKLLHELPSVYVASNANIKRVVLRLIQDPIQEIDQNSSEILVFVQQCPAGAETLVSRVIHIVTERKMPSQQLVSSVKDLYKKRVSDVRFLIPVLNGLSKKEIIDILPQLIKLNPVVVKEVFNRLLQPHVDSNNSYNSSISASDLLIALHNIDTAKCDLKIVIKATNLCFEEKNIYTSQVLAVVMQQLVEQNPLPTLLMRTVIQSLSHYPRMIGFILSTILQRLILKQVWNQKKVWEGFIKCVQRTMPQSINVLLQLPAAQLESVFAECSEIKPFMSDYIRNSVKDQQATPIPQSLMDVIMSSNLPTRPVLTSSNKEVSCNDNESVSSN